MALTKQKDPFAARDAHWLVDGVYDENAAVGRVEKTNAAMVLDSNYMNNVRRAANEIRREERELERELADYFY